MPSRVILAAALTLLGGCAGNTIPSRAGLGTISPPQAVLRAADAAPRGVRGIFAMRVKATGKEFGRVYLNSERDYRDQRNLTISIDPVAVRQLEQRFGMPPERYLKGKSVEVWGTARRVRIAFTVNGRRTDKYYFQTHVRISEGRRLLGVLD